MSPLGQKQTCAVQRGMSALAPKATSNATLGNVRFGPIADIANLIDPLRASSSGQEPDGTDENEADGPHEVEIEPTSREHFQTEPTTDKEGNCAAGSHHRERVRK